MEPHAKTAVCTFWQRLALRRSALKRAIALISILDFRLAILDCESQNLRGFRRLNL